MTCSNADRWDAILSGQDYFRFNGVAVHVSRLLHDCGCNDCLKNDADAGCDECAAALVEHTGQFGVGA